LNDPVGHGVNLGAFLGENVDADMEATASPGITEGIPEEERPRHGKAVIGILGIDHQLAGGLKQ